MQKGIALAAIVVMVVPVYTSAAVTFGRDKLKGTTKTQGDFNLAHRVDVEIDGMVVAGLRSIRGLQQSLQSIEYKDGEDATTHTRPGNHKPLTIEIVKTFSMSDPSWSDWLKSVVHGQTARKSVSVIFHNDAGAESGRLNFYNCWPTKWKGPSLNAKNSGHATEKLDLQCGSVTKA